MMRPMFRAVLTGAFLLVFAPQAQADTFLWRDDVHGFTISFPDSWTVQTEDSPSTRIRIAGPLAEDSPTCRVQVQEDGRVKIYPKRLTDEAVVERLDEAFWEQEAGQFNNARITDYYAPASLSGHGDATAIQVSFEQADANGRNVPMHGVVIASLYGGKRYVASCSSRAEVYERWMGLFGSILDSVELSPRYHPFATGYYRNFLMDPKLSLPRSKPGTVSERKAPYWIFENKYNR